MITDISSQLKIVRSNLKQEKEKLVNSKKKK